MRTTDFTYVSDDLQLAYSAERSALGEWVFIPGLDKWSFMGWLYEGQVRSMTDATDKTREYLRLCGRSAA